MRTDDFVPDYGTYSRIAEIQDIVRNGFSRRSSSKAATALSSICVNNREVRDRRRTAPEGGRTSRSDGPSADLERTTLKHGLSGPEVMRLLNGLHFLERLKLPCLWAVLGDKLLDLPEHEARAVVHDITRRIVREQKRARLPQYWLRVHECSGGFHSNIIFPASADMKGKILGWEPFQAYFTGERAIQEVYDFDGLGRSYLSKERAPYVKGGGRCGRRLNGSHRLGEGGGDRVQLSTAMRADAIEADVIEPWRRTKAKVLVPARPIVITPPIRLVASIETQPAVNTVVNAVVNPVQLSLFEDLPKRPYLVPTDVRTFREETGCTQAEVSMWIGVKNRSHVANFERGHDGLSPPRQRALKHFMETRRLAA